MRRAVLVAVLALALLAPAGAFAVQPRASLVDLENEVMCVACGVPLNIAESPQADRERDYIRGLIARGETKAQIKRDLVAQYGDNVLALPQDKGFSIAAYAVPIVVVAALIALLAVLVPRWRRRGGPLRTGATPPVVAGPPLDAADARRLDEDLARYES